MKSSESDKLREMIINKAKEFGATLAGIGRVVDLKTTPTYEKYDRVPYLDFFEALPEWPSDAESILVFALLHPRTEPVLDWWDSKPGGTPGNRVLIQIQNKMEDWLREEMDIKAYSLAYHLEKGGVFLKDAAVCASLGVIGKNNLLITPEYGPDVRLRASLLDVALDPSEPLDFDPCAGCDKPCFQACPQDAFRSGSFERKYCRIQMRKDQENARSLPHDPKTVYVRWCRACELSCPIGR
ncbi:MAG: hypothetical protein R6U57_06950 [Anaerolineales bacterium]